MHRPRLAGLGKRQQPLRVRPLVIETDHLQVTGAADHGALAPLARHALHGVVHPKARRPAMHRRAVARLLDLPPLHIRTQPGLGHLRLRRQCRRTHGPGHLGTLQRKAAWGVLGVGRIECHAPELTVLLQRLQDVLEVHQADATGQAGLAIPRRQAVANGLELRIGRGALAPLQQVGQRQLGQVHLVVHDHVVQVLRADLAGAVQPLQGKAAARA